MYAVLRFKGKEAFTKWNFIEPGYFYLLFLTEFLLITTLLAFLYFSSDSKPVEFPDSESEEEGLEMQKRATSPQNMEVEVEGDDLFNAQVGQSSSEEA